MKHMLMNSNLYVKNSVSLPMFYVDFANNRNSVKGGDVARCKMVVDMEKYHEELMDVMPSICMLWLECH
jgi:hypothetical protein